MTITRRGLLGMFAAGAAAAVLPSGIIMPVRKIVTPPFGVIGVDRASGPDVMVFETWTRLRDGQVRRDRTAIPSSLVASGDRFELARMAKGGLLDRVYIDSVLYGSAAFSIGWDRAVGDIPRESGKRLA